MAMFGLVVCDGMEW